jgi:CheY-like chemotaxis protein
MLNINNEQVKVLIVDDIMENIEIAGKVLESEGYDIYIADSGALQQQKPAAVLPLTLSCWIL